MNKLCAFFVILAFTAACSGADDDGSGGGSPPGGGCSGDITACSLGGLSDSQRADMCNLTLAAIDAPQGAKYECAESGAYLEVDSKAACLSRSYPATCTVKVSQILDCYKAAKTNACTAFSDNGACDTVIQSEGCR